MGSRLEAAATSSDRPTPMWTRLALAVLTLWLSMLILRQDVVIVSGSPLPTPLSRAWAGDGTDGVMCMVV